MSGAEQPLLPHCTQPTQLSGAFKNTQKGWQLPKEFSYFRTVPEAQKQQQQGIRNLSFQISMHHT